MGLKRFKGTVFSSAQSAAGFRIPFHRAWCGLSSHLASSSLHVHPADRRRANAQGLLEHLSIPWAVAVATTAPASSFPNVEKKTNDFLTPPTSPLSSMTPIQISPVPWGGTGGGWRGWRGWRAGVGRWVGLLEYISCTRNQKSRNH